MLFPDSGSARSRRPRQHHRHFDSRFLIPGLLLAFHAAAAAQSGLLEAHIISGDGQVCRPARHLPRPLIIEVTDETGTRVEDALVSFLLPEEGASGLFRNGLKTEILKTNSDGRVALRSLEVGGLSGRFQIRLTVAKGQARAGTISNQYVAPEKLKKPGVLSALKPGRRTLEIGGVLLAVVAGAYVKERASAGGSTVQPPPTIGPPSITIGKPQ